jgi:simple sugar transport system ATP-binding protein
VCSVERTIYSKARVLLLGEPLAAMGAGEARLIIGLIERLRARGDIAIVMIAHNYAQTLEICDRVVLMQHGEITFESQAAAISAEELLEIVRREYRAVCAG